MNKNFFILGSLLLLIIIVSFSYADNDQHLKIPIKEFKKPGSIAALEPFSNNQVLYLIQFDLSNDSLLNLIDIAIPDLQLWNGAASYQRIIPEELFGIIQNVLTDDYYRIISENYIEPDGRSYYTEFYYGNQMEGTSGEVGYECMCTDGSNCLTIGYNNDWWDPLDYYGEAWWAFNPPPFDLIDELKITVQGVQCDYLPVWSETYLTVKNNDCSLASDQWQAELSIDYTINGPYTLPSSMYNNILCNGAITPVIFSEDNYSVDYVSVEMYYTCNSPDVPNNFQASDAIDCISIELNWDNRPEIDSYTLYRDGQIINSLSPETTNYIDYSASVGNHNYCLESNNYCGNSEQVCDMGSREDSPLPPNNFVASDGIYSNYILLSWEDTSNETAYKIFRDGIWLSPISMNATEFIDQFVENEVEYNYCIESLNDCGSSELVCNSGFSEYINEYIMGDLNYDNSIDVLDVVRLVNIVLELDPATEYEILVSDMNNDTLINIQDIVMLVDIILFN